MKLSVRQANANATSANSRRADGRASAIQSPRPCAAPTMGMTPRMSATPRAIQSEKWPSSGVIVAASFAVRRRQRLGELGVALLRLSQGVGGFGRHVVLVVLGEHLAGDEDVALEPALRDDALALLEEVGKDAFVADEDRPGGVGDDEARLRALALERALLDHATDPERPRLRRLVRDDLRRRIEEDEVALERVEDESDRDRDRAGDACDDREPLLARLHRRCSSAASSRRTRRWRRATAIGSIAMQAA